MSEKGNEINFHERYDCADELREDYIKRYELDTKPVPENWNRSEADIVLRYFFDFELVPLDFSGKSVIDIGCGSGFLKESILRLSSTKRYVNFDSRRVSATSPDVVGNATGMPFQDNSFDLVMAFGSIAGVYWKDFPVCTSLCILPLEPLAEAVRILRKGGIVKVGPISLLRSCWRNEDNGRKYKLVRHKFINYTLSLKEKFPSLEIEFSRIVDKTSGRFDEWITFYKR